MAFDQGLAERVAERLVGAEEKHMFGGIGWMVQGSLAVGVIGDDLIVRVGPERYERYLQDQHARPFDFTGRPMKGWVYVAAEGIAEDADLDEWIQAGVACAQSIARRQT